MKFGIRFKLVFLGAAVSVLATAAALTISYTVSRSNGERDKVNSVNEWLNYMKDSVRNEQIYDAIKATKDYVAKTYAENPPTKKDFNTFKEKRNYYSNIFLWLYPFDGISMRYIPPEEQAFRADYIFPTDALSQAKYGSDGRSAYIAYYDSDSKRLIYLDDNLATLSNNKNEYHLPGDSIENFDATFTTDGEYLYKIINGEMTRGFAINDKAALGGTLAYVFISYDFAKAHAFTDNLIKVESITLASVSVGLIIIFAIFSTLLITRNIRKLRTSTAEFEQLLYNGQVLEVKDPSINSKDEIKELSDAFTSLEKSVINYSSALEKETKEKEKINAELNIASKIQLESLPLSHYNDKDFMVISSIKTAKEVGGDFYDYFYIDNNHFAFVIADVSGKGVPASLFMMRAKELIKYKLSTITSLEKAAYEINNTLIDNNKEGLFVTAFIGVIDLKKHTLKYLDAGHEKPYLLSKGKVSQIEANTNFVFGGVKNFTYKEEEMPFDIEDRLFLFTDGLNESINHDKEEFGYPRILESLTKYKEQHNDDIISNVLKDLDAFTNGEETFDDITLMLVEMKDEKKSLTLSYTSPSYECIEEITDAFNEKFSYIFEDDRSEIAIIIDEMINNYISYEKRKNLLINVNFFLKGNELEIVFVNNGMKFDPLKAKDKYIEKGEKDIAPGGVGIALVKQFSSNVKYERRNHLNYLLVSKTVRLK